VLEDDEFYMENGKFVLTERYHLRRGHCCGNGCRHCPYEHEAVPSKTRELKEPPWPYFEPST
jgi:hypothetical protein